MDSISIETICDIKTRLRSLRPKIEMTAPVFTNSVCFKYMTSKFLIVVYSDEHIEWSFESGHVIEQGKHTNINELMLWLDMKLEWIDDCWIKVRHLNTNRFDRALKRVQNGF